MSRCRSLSLALALLIGVALTACSGTSEPTATPTPAGTPTPTPTFEESVNMFMSASHEIYYDARSVTHDPLLFDGTAEAAEAVREGRVLFRALSDRAGHLLPPPGDDDAAQIAADFSTLIDSMLIFMDAFQQRSGEGPGDLTGELEDLFRTASFEVRDGFQTFYNGRHDMFERYDIPPADFPLQRPR